MLGIPTVIDRLLQQAIAQWLSAKYEEGFSNHSYGFREKRNAHQAVLKAQQNLREGYEWIVELDLEKFFDKVHHDRLMSTLAKKLTDKGTLKLIRNYLPVASCPPVPVRTGKAACQAPVPKARRRAAR